MRDIVWVHICFFYYTMFQKSSGGGDPPEADGLPVGRQGFFIHDLIIRSKRKRKDSNLRYRFRYCSFQDCCLQPLGHASALIRYLFSLHPPLTRLWPRPRIDLSSILLCALGGDRSRIIPSSSLENFLDPGSRFRLLAQHRFAFLSTPARQAVGLL